MSENIRYFSRRNHRRFPCGQTEYTKTVAELLPTILGDILTDLGFEVNVKPLEANGVDIEVFHGNNIVLVIEVLNWSIASRLTDKRKNSYIENLNEYGCNKLLIHTVPLCNLDGIEENGIQILEIGYQVLPEEYYNDFLRRGQVERRTMDCELTRREITARIQNYISNYLL